MIFPDELLAAENEIDISAVVGQIIVPQRALIVFFNSPVGNAELERMALEQYPKFLFRDEKVGLQPTLACPQSAEARCFRRFLRFRSLVRGLMARHTETFGERRSRGQNQRFAFNTGNSFCRAHWRSNYILIRATIWPAFCTTGYSFPDLAL